jgi:hypothetical protein
VLIDRVEYKYKVNRQIVSCEGLPRGWKCILRDEGNGGEAGSSSTSSSQSSSTSTSAAPSVTATICCATSANPELKGRLGRIVVNFPAFSVPGSTRIAIFKNGAEVKAGYGNESFELLPGTYEITMGGKALHNVVVMAGNDTNVKVGVLRITGAKNRRASVREGGQEIAGAYGGELIGLPIGTYDVQVAGHTEKVTISEGKITDF